MFCKRTHYALILMFELAPYYKESGITILSIAQKHNLPIDTFDIVIEQLIKSGYISQKENKLYLQYSPDNISIWDIIKCVDEGNLHRVESLESSDTQSHHTSAITMIDKEMSTIAKIVQYRLERHKLSAWSQKVHKIIYV